MNKENQLNNLDNSDKNNPLIFINKDPNSNQMEILERKDPSINSIVETELNEKPEIEEKKKKCSCKFPSAYTIIIILEIFLFILTYIIPKGKFWKLQYIDNNFKIIYSNGSYITLDASEDILKNYSINIPLENFKNGKIKKPLSIPNSYEKIDAKNKNFLQLFVYPIYGLIESSDVSFSLLVMGGAINIVIEMKALNEGMAALSRITKGKEFLLLCLVFFVISIGGSTFGMCEETLTFFPILMPIFLKSGMDGILGMSSIFMGSMIGIMFSTVNAFSVVLASDSAGISFTEGIVFRVISFVLGDTLTILYFYYYYKKIQKDEKNSVVYDIKLNLEKKYLSEESEGKEKKDEEKGNNIVDEKTNLLEQKENNKNKFTVLQKIALVVFILGFVVMIIGVVAFNWYFEYMTATFLVTGIILMFLLRKGEQEAIKIFVKGAGDFVGVALIIGLARGINKTLEDGNIQDTILNSLSKCIDGLPKVLFAIIMFLIFIFLGFFIVSQSGLAMLAMPVFAPLADNVNCSRVVVINAYMFGQSFMRIIAPSGIVMIVLQLVEIQYSHFVKFIWPYMVILFVLLILLIIINTFVS